MKVAGGNQYFRELARMLGRRWRSSQRAGLLLVVSSISPMVAASAIQQWQPQAAPDAQIVSGDKRFTVLTNGLVRLEYAPNQQFRDTATTVFVHRHLPVPSFELNDTADSLTLRTEQLTLTYHKHSGPFSQDTLRIRMPAIDGQPTWWPGKQNTGNLGGTARTLDGMDGGKDWQGKPVDLGQGLVSRSGWTLIDDSHSLPLTGKGDDAWPWVAPASQPEGYQDWYLFVYGQDYPQALQTYTQVAGKIPLPPRYAFGYWWSRYWQYSDAELTALMQQMRDYQIPIDVLVIDMDWHLTHGGLKDIKNPQLDPFGELLGWTGYTWNKALFPDPEGFLDWAESFNLKTALNLHPASGIPPMEAQYEAFAEHYGFDTSEQEYIPYRMADKAWADAYVETILRPLEQQGVDFWWLDWQQFPESKVVEGLSNTWWLNYVFFTDMERQQTRPLLFHRWGGLGNHRYQIGFSGDDKISWESLEYQSYFTATAANVGYGYWSHDIGGHGSGKLDKDPELYLRWLQFGVFSPILRTHSAKISTIERRFWQYPDHFEAMRDLVQLRYALHPYIYTAARQAYDTGISIVRPMYYSHPDTEAAYTHRYQYMFGDDLLVAPVASPVSPETGLAEKSLWLPPGQWVEWFTGTLLDGNQTLTRDYAQEQLPVFAKAGAIIPQYPQVEHLQQAVAELHLHIMPGDKGQTRLYEDAGSDLGYQQQAFATTDIQHQADSPTQRTVTIAAVDGHYAGQPQSRTIQLVLPLTLPLERVEVNGEALAPEQLGYRGAELANVVQLPPMPIDQALTITLHSAQPAAPDLLSGKPGQFARLSEAVAALKVEVARENWWASLPNLMLTLEQTPRLMERHPEQAKALLTKFDASYAKLAGLIDAHKDIRPAQGQKFKAFLGLTQPSSRTNKETP